MESKLEGDIDELMYDSDTHVKKIQKEMTFSISNLKSFWSLKQTFTLLKIEGKIQRTEEESQKGSVAVCEANEKPKGQSKEKEKGTGKEKGKGTETAKKVEIPLNCRGDSSLSWQLYTF